MATKRATSSPGAAADLQAAAELILQREEERKARAQSQARRRRRERLRHERDAIKKMQHSIEVIKWCIVAICSVWVLSFAISIFVLVQVRSKVAEIEGQVQRIRHAMDNPLATAGARFGGQLDQKLKDFLGFPELESEDQ